MHSAKKDNWIFGDCIANTKFIMAFNFCVLHKISGFLWDFHVSKNYVQFSEDFPDVHFCTVNLNLGFLILPNVPVQDQGRVAHKFAWDFNLCCTGLLCHAPLWQKLLILNLISIKSSYIKDRYMCQNYFHVWLGNLYRQYMYCNKFYNNARYIWLSYIPDRGVPCLKCMIHQNMITSLGFLLPWLLHREDYQPVLWG